MRIDGRKSDQLRAVSMQTGYLKHAHGSVLVSMGETRLICTAMLQDRVPPHAKEAGTGWLTAEYSMLPASTPERKVRDRGKIDGRNQEIQRLVGRCLRTVVDYSAIGGRTVWVDCDVIQADGGTRTAAINGAFPAVVMALENMRSKGVIDAVPVPSSVAAVSVGIVDGEVLLDLNYAEDAQAEVDMNVVATGSGDFVEIQGTAERAPFSHDRLEEMLRLARKGIEEISRMQKDVLGDLWPAG